MFNFNYIKAQTNTLPPSGNVGIGTMTPAAKLEVVGNSMLRGSVTIDSNVLVRDSATFQKKLTVNQDIKIKGTSVFVDNANFKSELKVLGVAKMKNKLVVDSLVVMNSDARIMGNLKLPNLSTTNNPTMFLTTNANGKVASLDKSGLINAIYTSPSTCLSTGVNVGLPIWSALSNANFGVLYTGIDCPARVGIGTNNPIASLHVVGNGFFQGNLGVNTTPTTTEVVKISSTIDRTSLEITNNHPTAFATKYGIKNIVNNPNTIAYSVTNQATNQDVFVVKGNGSVGVGTDNPLELFQIGEEFTFHSGGTKAIARNYYFDNAQNASRRIKDGPASALRFNEGGSIDLWTITNGLAGSIINPSDVNQGLHIANNGNVGIGTTAVNGAKLSVEGTVRVRKIQVDNPAIVWSDFVFHSNYALMPLNELATFITKNNHLPDVPSEKEVKENGIDLAQMDAVLLRKIEELTLYIIQLKKENEVLQAKMLLLENH